MSDTISLKLVKFIAEEVERQRDDAIAVWWMISAWLEAQRIYQEYSQDGQGDPRFRLRSSLVAHLGGLVQPTFNSRGFRQHRILVGQHEGTFPRLIQVEMDQLFASDEQQRAMDPASLYKAFEEIHPFGDGNGRTGKIIYNWRNGTLDDPQMPPNFWGCSNP